MMTGLWSGSQGSLNWSTYFGDWNAKERRAESRRIEAVLWVGKGQSGAERVWAESWLYPSVRSTPWAGRRWRWRWSRCWPAERSPRGGPSPTPTPWTSSRTFQSCRTTEGGGGGRGPPVRTGPPQPRTTDADGNLGLGFQFQRELFFISTLGETFICWLDLLRHTQQQQKNYTYFYVICLK